MSRSEAALQSILDTMQESEVFPRTKKDIATQFWLTYERLANKYDNQYLQETNTSIDSLLVFVRGT